MEYQLNIAIDAAGVQTIISAGQVVALSSPLPDGITTPTVLWVAFSPNEQNTVTWENSCGIYVTTAPLDPGSTLTVASQTDETAEPGWTYVFEDG
jgi:hypothetical protein